MATIGELIEENAKATLESNETDKGNTNKEETLSVFRIHAKNVILTVNEASLKHLDDIVKYLGKYKGCNYMLVCSHDKPQYHVHIYVQYSNTVHLSSQWLFGAHIEKCHGSAQQNIKYCKGEDEKHKTLGIKCETILERGEPDCKGIPKTIRDVKNMDMNDLEELDPKYYRTIKEIKKDIEEEEAIDDWLNDYNINVVWHYGDPGSGKTWTCKQIGREFRKMGKKVATVSFDKNGFAHFIGSKDCELLIINEFRDSNIPLKYFLEILTNEHVYNIKNAQVYLRHLKQIQINSIQNPCDIYKVCYENRRQIYRRINEIYYHSINKKNGCKMVTKITWDLAKNHEWEQESQLDEGDDPYGILSENDKSIDLDDEDISEVTDL